VVGGLATVKYKQIASMISAGRAMQKAGRPPRPWEPRWPSQTPGSKRSTPSAASLPPGG
jgi:hypothetical protein